MRIKNLKTPHFWLVIVIAMLTPLCSAAQDAGQGEYTTGHPLVYEDAWDLWPYSFLNEHGEAEGFNIDLVRMLMHELDIPYTIKLKPRREALADLKEGHAHLTFGMKAKFHSDYGHYGKTVIQLFTHSLLSAKDKPVNVRLFSDLGNTQTIVHKNSFSHHLMIDNGWGDNAIPVSDMKEAVKNLSSTLNGQVLWNTASLKWLMRMYHTDNLQLTPVNMPYGEYRFISNDSVLLNRLDRAYSELLASGKLEPIQNKWFYPEKVDTGIPAWIWYLTAITAFVLLVLIYYHLFYRLREKMVNKNSERRNNRLSLVLQTSQVRIWLYDVSNSMYTWTDRNGQPLRQYTDVEMSMHFTPEDYEMMCEAQRQVISMEKKTVTLEIDANDIEQGTEGVRTYRVTLGVLRYKNGRPVLIMGTRQDITEEREKQRKAKERLMKYQSIFDTSMVDMIFYDADGYITNINEQCCKTLHHDQNAYVQEHVNVRDLFTNTNINVDNMELPLTTLLLNDKAELNDLKSRDEKDIMYYEMQLVPVYDNAHHIIGAYGTGRDVSEVARAHHQIQRNTKRLQKANDNITEYINNINYALESSGTRRVSYSPYSHTLTVYKGQNVEQLSLTQSRCMTLISKSSRKTAMRALNNMDSLTTEPVNIELETVLRRRGMTLYLNFSFLPIYDEEGRVASYLGFCKDDSETKATENLLAIETARAQDVEELKNSFLRNMSYEIRTPLSSVVGFAELFDLPHDANDEELFISQIKDSSQHLLHLINDILFLSRLDAHMIEIRKQPTDFAQTFEGHCHTGWEKNRKEGVHYVTENRFDKLVVDIDDGNVGRIIEQIVDNATRYTSQGTVLGRYEYINGNLMIAIEDTGTGMSEEVLADVYTRFNNNRKKEAHATGLGLPICKELAEQMGGSLNINSVVGKGTTVWISIPCTAIEVERKKDILATE